MYSNVYIDKITVVGHETKSETYKPLLREPTLHEYLFAIIMHLDKQMENRNKFGYILPE